jgi:hypothetical protein
VWINRNNCTHENLSPARQICWHGVDKVEYGAFLRIEKLPSKPQSDSAIFVCHMLSNFFQPIQVFRYDQILQTIYIQAGTNDGIALIIDNKGNWEFVL